MKLCNAYLLYSLVVRFEPEQENSAGVSSDDNSDEDVLIDRRQEQANVW